MKKTFYTITTALLSLFATNIAHGQIISTYTGTGVAGYTTDVPPILATTSQVNFPNSVAVDASGNVYVADYENHRIRKIDNATGNITTIAGTGTGAFWGDGSAATAAAIKWPRGMAFDASGNLYFCDFGNNVIRKIDAVTGIISTIAGLPGTLPSYAGDLGLATAANLGNPTGIAIHPLGYILIADQQNHCIRRIDMGTGIITTAVGNGLIGIGAAGDGGIATAAKLNEPTDVAVDGAGNVYIADNGNNRVRKVNISTGIISTHTGVVAGTVPGSVYGYAGDGGPATAARIYYPQDIAVDGPGNVYIADWNNNVIRRVNTSGLIYTAAGTGAEGFSGDGGLAVAAMLDHPLGVAVRASDGDFFIADNENNRVRRVKVGNDPYFTAGASKTVTICPTEFTNIDSALRVDDIDVGQTLSWSPVTLPAHGTLVATYSAPSTGSTVTPSGLTYAPALGYIGTDVFTVRVTDGIASDTITINANLIDNANPGVLSGADSVCPGQTVMESSTVPGGTWSSSSTATATVSASGGVMGVAAGTVTITYTATNTCGSVFVTKTMTVIATVPCVNSVKNTNKGNQEIKIMPNPSHGSFIVNVPSDTKDAIQIEVTDVAGRSILMQEIVANKDTPIDMHTPPGIYMLYVNISGERVMKKLVIN